jgi:hypothetical protein
MPKIEMPAIFFFRRRDHAEGESYVFAVDPHYIAPHGSDVDRRKPIEVRVPVPHDQDYALTPFEKVLITIEVPE